jgi:hypothetical protein
MHLLTSALHQAFFDAKWPVARSAKRDIAEVFW